MNDVHELLQDSLWQYLFSIDEPTYQRDNIGGLLYFLDPKGATKQDQERHDKVLAQGGDNLDIIY